MIRLSISATRNISAGLAIALAISAPSAARTTGDPIIVDGGQIEGVWARNSEVRSYLGVPFAAAPIGDSRWREPQPVHPWAGVRKAATQPPACVQGSRAPGSVSIEAYGDRDVPVSEDCLYLNVWTPTDIPSGQKLPVMVWFHGGGFTSGTAAKPEFNGETLASKGMIVVVPNYRLGIFGFFAHPDLTAESAHHASGNYGLLDQVAALQWVQRNIARFGGDPQKVMIIGQSAGSGAVNQHMASPISRGLFQRAVAMSGPVGLGDGKNLASAEAEGKHFGQMIAASLEDLRKIPADVLYSISVDMKARFSPIVDGYFLPESAGRIWKQGAIAKVPYMTGWSSHEFYEGVYDRTLAAFRKQAADAVGEANVPELMRIYNVTDDSSATAARVGLARDPMFGLNTWRAAQMASAAGLKTYMYYWARPTQAWPGQSLAENSPASLLGAYHGSQVPYLFGNLQLLDRELKPVDRQLSRDWQTALILFGQNGEPADGRGQAWPAYSAKNEKAVVITDRFSIGDIPNRDKMAFFEKVGASNAGRPSSGFVNGR